MTQFLLLIGPTYLIALAFLLHWAFGWFETFFPFARSLHFRYISGIVFTAFALLMPAAFFMVEGKVQGFFRRVGYMTVAIVIYLSMFIFAVTVILWIAHRIMGHIHPDRIYCEVTDKSGMVKRVKRPLWGPWAYRIFGTLIIAAVAAVSVMIAVTNSLLCGFSSGGQIMQTVLAVCCLSGMLSVVYVFRWFGESAKG